MVDKEVVNLINLKVLSEMPESDKKEIDIIAILEIASTILTLISGCPAFLDKDVNKLLNVIQHPNIFNKAALYFALRKQLSRAKSVRAIGQACLKAGSNATLEDVQTLLTAAELGDDKIRL